MARLTGIAAGLTALAACAAAGAQMPPRLITDLRTTDAVTSNNPPTGVASASAGAVFRLLDRATGAEAWVTDGTPAGTVLAADETPGPGSSGVEKVASAGPWTVIRTGGALYFTNGTAAETEALKSLLPSGLTPEPTDPMFSGGFWYFFASSGSGAVHVVRSDFTPAGTTVFPATTNLASPMSVFAVLGQRVIARTGASALHAVDLANTGMAEPLAATPLNNQAIASSASLAYFLATEAATGLELWRTDGTMAGTFRLSDFAVGTADSFSSNATGFIDFGTGEFMSVADKWPMAPALVRSSGTVASTGPVVNFTVTENGSGAASYAVAGLTRIIAVPIGTRTELRELILGAPFLQRTFRRSSGNELVFGPTVGQQVYLVADDAATGRELWVSSQATSSTTLVADVNPGTASSSPTNLRLLPDQSLVFHATGPSATDPSLQPRIYRTSTGGPTAAIGGPTPLSPSFEVSGTDVIYAARTAEVPLGLFKVNALTSEVTLLKALAVPTGSSSPRSLKLVGDVACLIADAPTPRIVRSDGSAIGTTGVTVPSPRLGTSDPSGTLQSVVFNGAYCYPATSSTTGAEIARYNPATEASAIIDILPGSTAATNASMLTPIGDRLYFQQSCCGGLSIGWTAFTTPVATTVYSGTQVSAIAPIGNELLFAGNGSGVLRTTGANANSWTLVGAPTFVFAPPQLPVFFPTGLRVYYLTHTVSGYPLSMYDRTADAVFNASGQWAGQAVGVWVQSGRTSVFPMPDGTAFFYGQTPAVGTELFRTNGAPTGVSLVADLTDAQGSSTFLGAAPLGNRLVFLRQGPTQVEAWITNAPNQPPTLLGSFGRANAGPRAIVEHRGRVYFSIPDSTGGRIYVTDGTTSGTGPLPPIQPAGCTNVTDLFPAGSRLFFAGIWTIEGAELGLVDLCPADVNNSGATDIDDLFILLNRFFSSDPRADFDRSGTVNLDDLFVFLNAWFAGCA